MPPSTTRKVQPLDAGIITWLKAGFRQRLVFHVFDSIDMGRKSICNVNVNTAMFFATEIRKSCPAGVIKNCFDHCLKMGTEMTAEKRRMSERDTVDEWYATPWGTAWNF